MSTAIEESPARPRKPVRELQWTYKKYQRLVDQGACFNKRVELLGGRLIEMAPQIDLHAAAIGKGQRAIEKSFGPNHWVRLQLPLHLDRRSGPEPDICVVPGSPDDYVGTGHPKTAMLVVEVSLSTLRYYRRKKGPRYARAGYQDYWIVNLKKNCLEVYRNPVQDPSAPLGWRYADVKVMQPSESVTPVAGSEAILIADLLPVWPGAGNGVVGRE